MEPQAAANPAFCVPFVVRSAILSPLHFPSLYCIHCRVDEHPMHVRAFARRVGNKISWLQDCGRKGQALCTLRAGKICFSCHRNRTCRWAVCVSSSCTPQVPVPSQIHCEGKAPENLREMCSWSFTECLACFKVKPCLGRRARLRRQSRQTTSSETFWTEWPCQVSRNLSIETVAQ